MPHDEVEPADHGGVEPRESPVGSGTSAPSAVGTPFVPMAEAISPESGVTLTPDPEGTPIPSLPIPDPERGPELPFPWPGGHYPRPCRISLPEGCYRIAYRPNASSTAFYGTMRVDYAGGRTTVSGDLYRYLRIPYLSVERAKAISNVRRRLSERIGTLSSAAVGVLNPTVGPATLGPLPYGIPIYPRNRYYSYLKVTNVERPGLLTYGPCQLKLTAQEYLCTQPPAGSFDEPSRPPRETGPSGPCCH